MASADKIYIAGGTYVWNEFIRKISTIDQEQIQYFMLWRLACSHFNKLPKQYRHIWKQQISSRSVRSFLSDADVSEEYQGDCLKELGHRLPVLSGHIYLNYSFNSTSNLNQRLKAMRRN